MQISEQFNYTKARDEELTWYQLFPFDPVGPLCVTLSAVLTNQNLGNKFYFVFFQTFTL